MAANWKGQLAYKDINGIVWNIVVKDDYYQAGIVNEELPVGSAYLGELIELIDDITEPEWTKADPSNPVQIEALDRGAFPDATESHIDIVKRVLDATESHIELGTE